MRKNTIKKIGKHVVTFDGNAAATSAGEPPFGEALLTVEQVAKLLNCSVSALNKWRIAGRGPRFVKIERCVRYRRGDIAAFIHNETRESTSAA